MTATTSSSPTPRPRSLPVGLWLALAALAVGLVGLFFGLAPAILTLAGTTLAGSIFLAYSSLVSLAGEAQLNLEEALTLVAPLPAEEQKRAVLRALKDLEYEREVGKISAADHAELVARYRAEARHLLQVVAEVRTEQLERAEQRADAYLSAALGDASRPPPQEGPPNELLSPPPHAQAARVRCPACGRRIGRRARYCQACGTAIEARRRHHSPPASAGDPES